MRKIAPALSRGMLILGGLLILAGLGWGLWRQLNAPPEPTIGEEGAVVLAVTAPIAEVATRELPTPPATSAPTEEIKGSLGELGPSSPTAEEPHTEGPTPELLPDWTVTAAATEPTTIPAATDTPLPPDPTVPPPIASSPPTRIVAPSIKLDATVVPMGWEMIDRNGAMVSEWQVPKKAAGWHMNSALPGQGENVVLSGHHNIEGKVFRYVVDLDPGDEITLYTGDTAYVYIVTEKYILKESGMPLKVRQKNAQWIMPTGDERLTLVTCWPYEWPGNSHRVIVVARPPAEPREPSQSSQ